MSTANPTPTPTPPAPAPRRWKKRFVIPLGVLAVLLILLAAAYVRGTWADTEPRDPKSPDEGILCRLYQPPQDTWQVRCSMILSHRPEQVWKVVTDYDHFADIFPTLKSCKAEKKDNARWRLTGEAHSLLGA